MVRISPSPLGSRNHSLTHLKLSNFSVSEIIYTPQNPKSFNSILNLHIHNKRFKTQATSKPLAIITARSENHVHATVKCAKSNGIQVRIRSGGHDYEGLSYVSDVSYVVLDMFPLHKIDLDMESGTAWVQAGATLGELSSSSCQQNQTSLDNKN